MSPEQKQLVEFAIQDLVAEIVKHNELSPEDAIDRLYHSRFFEHLTNPATGLYREGPDYLYSSFVRAEGQC